MKDRHTMRAWSLLALSATAVLPIALACQPPQNNPPPNVATTASGAYPYAAAPPGYPPAYPGQPGYPAPTAAQPSYPPATTGQAAYPAAPPPGYAAPGYPAPGTMPPGPAQPAPSGSSAPGLAPTDPNSLQGILQGIQSALQGQTVPGGGGGIDLTDIGLKAYALRVAPGMQPDGDELKQTLQQGQHAVMMVTLQAGKGAWASGLRAGESGAQRAMAHPPNPPPVMRAP